MADKGQHIVRPSKKGTVVVSKPAPAPTPKTSKTKN